MIDEYGEEIIMIWIGEILLSRYTRTLLPFAAAASSQQEACSSIICMTSKTSMGTNNSTNSTRIKESPQRVVISQITDETTTTSFTLQSLLQG